MHSNNKNTNSTLNTYSINFGRYYATTPNKALNQWAAHLGFNNLSAWLAFSNRAAPEVWIYTSPNKMQRV
jgi:hypothetical protein